MPSARFRWPCIALQCNPSRDSRRRPRRPCNLSWWWHMLPWEGMVSRDDHPRRGWSPIAVVAPVVGVPGCSKP
jgi:hypothetical protein